MKGLRLLRHPTRTRYMQVSKIVNSIKEESDSKDEALKTLNEQVDYLLRCEPISKKNKVALDDRKMQIAELGLSTRTFNCLLKAGFSNVESLLLHSDFSKLHIRNFGVSSRNELINKMCDHGYVEWAKNMAVAFN